MIKASIQARSYILTLLALQWSPSSSQLHFAFHNQSLYASLGRQWGDRGIHTLFNLHSLLSSKSAGEENSKVPDCYGTMAQIRDDLAWNHTLSSGKRVLNDFGSDFAFWRKKDDFRTILWPDYDYDGWTFAWIPPLSLVADQFNKEMGKWSSRDPRVFFTGKLSSRKGHIRERFRTCSESHPDLFLADITDWGRLRRQEHLYRNLNRSISSPSSLSSSLLLPFWTKPIEGDLRRMLNYKYLIYLEGNTWSTSLKRILVAGGVVILPLPNPHETFTMNHIMSGCKDCFLFYNHTELSSGNCTSLVDVVKKHDSSHLSAMRDRLRAHMGTFVGDRSKLRRLQLDALSRAADQNALPTRQDDIRADNGTLVIHGETLQLVTCSAIKRMLREKVGSMLDWQMDLWFDKECNVRPSAQYLATVAI